MCRFTFIRHLGCGCEGVSKTPEDTQLCQLALSEGGLTQSIDGAAPACVPFNDEDAVIASRQERLGHCVLCRNKYAQDRRDDRDNVRQLHGFVDPWKSQFPLDPLGPENKLMEGIENTMERLVMQCTEMVGRFEQLLHHKPDVLRFIRDRQLRMIMSIPGARNHQILPLQDLDACRELLRHSRILLQGRAPRKLFLDHLDYLQTKVKNIQIRARVLLDIHNCLETYQGSRPSKHFNGSAARLRFLLLMYRSTQDRRGYDKVRREHYLHPDVVMDPEVEQRIQEEQEHLERILRLPNTRPAHRTANPRPYFARNRNNLAFEMPRRLLADNRARDVEVQHVYFVEGKKANSKKRFGNRFLFDAHGNSTAIFADARRVQRSESPSPPAEIEKGTANTSTSSSELPKKKRKRTPPSASSNSDPESESDEPKIKRKCTLKSPRLAPKSVHKTGVDAATTEPTQAPTAVPVAPPSSPAEHPLRRSTRIRRVPVWYEEDESERAERLRATKRGVGLS